MYKLLFSSKNIVQLVIYLVFLWVFYKVGLGAKFINNKSKIPLIESVGSKLYE